MTHAHTHICIYLYYNDTHTYIIMWELFRRTLAILQIQSNSLPGRLDDSSFCV